jgi:hypothetical protein
VAAGDTLSKTPSQSAYSSLQNHQLGNGITPPVRAGGRVVPFTATHESRVAPGVRR